MKKVVRNYYRNIRLQKEIDENRKITLEEMANFLRLSKTQLSEFENQNKQPSTKTLLTSSEILELPMEKIVYLEEIE